MRPDTVRSQRNQGKRRTLGEAASRICCLRASLSGRMAAELAKSAVPWPAKLNGTTRLPSFCREMAFSIPISRATRTAPSPVAPKMASKPGPSEPGIGSQWEEPGAWGRTRRRKSRSRTADAKCPRPLRGKLCETGCNGGPLPPLRTVSEASALESGSTWNLARKKPGIRRASSCSTWNAGQRRSGITTWRDFSLLASRTSAEEFESRSWITTCSSRSADRASSR